MPVNPTHHSNLKHSCYMSELDACRFVSNDFNNFKCTERVLHTWGYGRTPIKGVDMCSMIILPRDLANKGTVFIEGLFNASC